MRLLKLGRYRHYKGHEYEVIGIARHSETLEELVVYKALQNYEEFKMGQIWVRPLPMFSETVSIDGETIMRFEYIGDKPMTHLSGHHL